ncbi:MAG TPA: carboxypeptidase-like regulatory domain-containing protein [Candidatus Sulfotelmatobacter sp.]|nr:carboxypeptidase-like regulatory domain-containing protein [Candidatus Sulfotelmatobacter sp.]
MKERNRALKNKPLALLALGCALVAAGRAVRRDHDYRFGVTGVVSAEDGTPINDVEVILNLDTPVYEGITPITTKRVTANNGAFVLMYISGSPSTKYTITIQKQGFEPQTVAGSAPPDGHHVFRLKRIRDGDHGTTTATGASVL